MARFRLKRQQVEGRLVAEDDTIIRVATPAGGTTAYLREEIEDLELFAIGARQWHERVGDYHQERAWEVEEPVPELNRARRAYQRGLLYATEPDEEELLKSKLEMLAADRRELQQERLRHVELQEAREKAELVRLERQLTEARLEALAEQRAEIAQLGRLMQENQRRMALLDQRIELLDRRVEELDDDVDRLRRFDFDVHFVRRSPFLRLKRDVERLEREVGRLEREAAGG
jgi:galactokinase